MASGAKWIKIVTDIFEDEKIVLIESMPEADAILVIWFKLLCLAGKQNNGGRFIVGGINLDADMLAKLFHRPVEIVELALDTFAKYGMIQMGDGPITITKWDNHQSLDAYDRLKQKDRERKRQKYQEQKAQGQRDAAEEAADPPDYPSTDPPEPATVMIELILNDGTTHGVTDKDVERYRELYPGVDVMQELRNMAGWCDSNKPKRKTRTGIKRFITNWLAREQDRAGSRNAGSPQGGMIYGRPDGPNRGPHPGSPAGGRYNLPDEIV